MTARFPSRAGATIVGSFHFVQSLPSALWTVTHGLGFVPDVQVFDSAGDQVEGDVTHVSANQLTIAFSAGFAGDAYLN